MGGLSVALSVLILSFVVTSALIIPFINLLYKWRFQRAKQVTIDAFGKRSPIFDAFHGHKAGVPVGGGALIITVVTLLFIILLPIFSSFGLTITSVYTNKTAEIGIILLTFLSFGLLGLYDDVKKFFRFSQTGFFGLRIKHKFLIELMIASLISVLIYTLLGINFIYLPFIGTINMGIWVVPFMVLTIVSFANAVNITDGLDGLASGSLMISLFGLWFLSATILDIPLTIFIALWLGSLISFLYFNVFPARIFMGDVGSLSFGATLAVVGILLGKIPALVVIGFIFVLEVTSSLLQLSSKKWRKKKIFPVSPVHLWLQKIGWEEPKIVQRAWLVQIMLTLFGLWLAVL